MIKIVNDDKTATISGNPVEVMFFYCVWQSELYSGWNDNEKVIKTQIKNVLNSIKSGEALVLHNLDKIFKNALQKAIEYCKSVEIEIKK